MKKRETVTAFDFENAFKALSELDIPKVDKKQNSLNEHFTRSNVTNVLMEDYYNVNDVEDLEQAQNDRQEEIAQAKLARIEKIVDIDAESPEDILPSYVGKHIIQCPQCMTLFYKDPEDIEISEEDETICNNSEICQHCGNDSGYMLIGKVEAVEEVEEESQLEEIPVEETEGQDEEDLDNEEVSEEENIEDQQEEVEDEESLNLEPAEEKEAVDESLQLSEELSEEPLNEAVDKELDDKLQAHNEYIEYLKDEIEKAEKELENAKNEFVKKSIEARLDSLKADLEAALPEALKDEVQDELPAADEIEEVKESLKESIDVQKLDHEDIFDNPYTALYVARDITHYFIEVPEDAEKLVNDWGAKTLEGYEQPIMGDLIRDALVAWNWHEESEEWGTDTLPVWWSDRCSSAQKVDMDNYINACKNDDDRYHLLFLAINSLALEYGYEWYGFKESFNNVKKALTETLKEDSAKELLQDFADSLGEELKETIEEDVETEEKLAEFEQKLEDLDKEDEEEESLKAAIDSKVEPIEVVEEDAKIQEDFVDDVSSEEFKDLVYNPIYQEALEEEFEELDECTLNEHISGYLNNVYENVKSFEATNCSFENDKLIVEGNINFNSGNVNKSKFEFIKEDNSFVGKNSALCEGLSFTLNYKVENKVIITESFKYKYNIGENLVEGIVKK